MPESRMNEVAQALLSQSKDHEVSWEETTRRGSYRVVFPDVVLIVSRTYPTLEDSDLSLELMGETGRVVDSLHTKPEDDMHPVLSQIFNLAEQDIRDYGINKALGYLKRTGTAPG